MCKSNEGISCLFATTLSCNPVILLQSVRIGKIVYEHGRSRNNKKIRMNLIVPAEITKSRKFNLSAFTPCFYTIQSFFCLLVTAEGGEADVALA